MGKKDTSPARRRFSGVSTKKSNSCTASLSARRAMRKPPPPGEDDPHGRRWLNLFDADDRPTLAFQQVDRLERATWPDPTVPQQLHLDLEVDDVAALDAAHERILRLGGVLLEDRRDDPEEALRVYADPDGHPFCVFVP